MRRSDIGEFEEVVLLMVAVLTPNAYSVAIAQSLEVEMGKSVSTGAVHAALQRMEKKGLVSSHMGEATSERGGRRKRLFSVTVAGSSMLHKVQEIRKRLWEQIPPTALPQTSMN